MRDIKREDLPECKGYDCNCATEGYSLNTCILYWEGKCASPIWDHPEPNDETKQAIEEARQGIGVVECESVDEMFKNLFGMKIKDKT